MTDKGSAVTDESSEVHALSLGAMVGGTRPSARAWREAVMALSRRVAAARDGVDSPLRVNVVYQVPGEVVPVTFEGVRTGRYAAGDRHLLVQAALPEQAPDEPEALLIRLLHQAVDAAAAFARKKGLADDLVELRELVSSL
jgi:hypothetical protein